MNTRRKSALDRKVGSKFYFCAHLNLDISKLKRKIGKKEKSNIDIRTIQLDSLSGRAIMQSFYQKCVSDDVPIWFSCAIQIASHEKGAMGNMQMWQFVCFQVAARLVNNSLFSVCRFSLVSIKIKIIEIVWHLLNYFLHFYFFYYCLRKQKRRLRSLSADSEKLCIQSCFYWCRKSKLLLFFFFSSLLDEINFKFFLTEIYLRY